MLRLWLRGLQGLVQRRTPMIEPMTDEQINIAIAEWLGYKFVSLCNATTPAEFLEGTLNGESQKVPNYVNDLNAMHSAEDTLTPDQLTEYCNRLSAPVSAVGIPHKSKAIRATARQRAEAFLRTLNLWKD
jgi:hypothetical protein